MKTPSTVTGKHPFHGGACYACDARAVGLRDRRPEGGALETACARHADPTIAVYCACIYCDGVVRAGSLDIDGSFAHAKCHRDIENGNFHSKRGLA